MVDLLANTKDIVKEVEKVKGSPEAAISFNPSQLQKDVEEDIAKQKTPAPVINLDQLIGTTTPLSELQNVPSGIYEEDLSAARYYVQAKNKGIKFTPEEESEFSTILDRVFTTVDNARTTAQLDVPKFPIAFTDRYKKVKPEYDYNYLGILPNDKKAFAHNRINLQNFMSQMKTTTTTPDGITQTLNFMESNPKAAEVLNKHFATGAFFQEVKREFLELGGGLNVMASAVVRIGKDFIESFAKAASGETQYPLEYFKKNSINRKNEHEAWINDPSRWLDSHTTRLNEFIKEKYIQDNGEEAYQQNIKDLTLNPNQALQLFNYSFTEQNMLEQIANFGVVNLGSTFAIIGAGKAITVPYTLLTKGETPRNFYLRMNSERIKAGLPNMPTTEYINYKYGKSLSPNTPNPFKKLYNFFGRQKAKNKGELGFHSVAQQEKNISQKFTSDLKNAELKLQEVKKGGNQAQINAAEKILMKAEDNYRTELIRKNPIDPDNLVLLPRKYLASVAGAEAFPSTIQGLSYYMFSNPDDPDSLETTEFYSALAYLTAATGIAGLTTGVIGTQLQRFDIVHDVSYVTKSMIDDMTGLMEYAGLDIPKLIDTDVSSLQIADFPGGPERQLTPKEYNGLMQLQQVFNRLAPESQLQSEKNRQKLNSQLKTIDNLIPNLPSGEPSEEKKFILNALKLSYAETSSVLAFQSVGTKIATHLNLRDVIKVSDRFLQSVKFSERANDRLAAHSKLLRIMENNFTELAPNMDRTGRAKFTDVINFVRKTNDGMTKQLQEKKDADKIALESITTAFRDGHSVVGKKADELAKVAEELFEASRILGEDGKLKQTIKELGIKPSTDNNLFKEFAKTQEQNLNNLADLNNTLLEHLNNSIANYNFTQANGAGVLREVGESIFGITDSYKTKTNDILYSTVDMYDPVKATDLYNAVIDLQKGSSFSDGISEDKLLSMFRPDSDFVNSYKGSRFVQLLNKNADNGMLEAFMKAEDQSLPIAEIRANATENLNAFKTQMEDAVRTKYKLKNYHEVGSVHYYDYLKNNPFNGNEFNLDDMTMSIQDVDYFYRDLSKRASELMSSKDPLLKETGIKYSNLATRVDNVLKRTEGGKELGFVRLEQFAFVGNKNKEGSFFGEFNNYKSGVKKVDEKDLILRKAAGVDLIRVIDSNATTAEKTDAVKNLIKASQEEFGVHKFPPEYADPENPTRLNRNLNLNEILPNGKSVKKDIRDQIESGKFYKLDNSTELGRAGLKRMNLAFQTLFREMGTFEKEITTLTGRLKVDFKGSKRVGPVNTVFTKSDGTGLSAYKEMQEALTFPLANGEDYTIDIDQFIKQQTNLTEIFENNQGLALQYNEYINSVNSETAKLAKQLEGKLATDDEMLRRKHYRILGFDPQKGTLLESYLKGLPKGIEDVDADVNRLTLFEEDMKFAKQQYKADPTNKASDEEIDKYFAGVLLQEVYETYGQVKPEYIRGINGEMLTGSVMQNPVGALEVLEQATTKAIFKKLGVTNEQYDAMLAVVGHSVYVDYIHKNSFKGTGAISLPEVGYTDTGIISRAFNYARGLVSKEYLLVEAGFRLMRDNDLRMLDFILNDPEAADLFTELLKKKSDPNKIKYLASTFPERIRAYAARQFAFAGNSGIVISATTYDMYEEPKESDETFPELAKEITQFRNPGQFGGEGFPEIQQ